MSIEAYLEEQLQIHVHGCGAHMLRALCPVHGERTPSLAIYPDGHAYCYGCHEFFSNVAHLIWKVEFPKDPTPKRGYNRAEALGYMEPTAPRQRTPIDLPFPSGEQVRAMTIMFNCYHEFFLDSRLGRPARTYLQQERRLVGPYQSNIAQAIGYVPFSPRAHGHVLDLFRGEFGNDWWDMALSIGVIRPSGGQRLKERVIFAARDEWGDVIGYQGRVLYSDTEARKLGMPKYLNPPISRSPLVPLPAEEAKYPGTFIVEGPVDALAYAVCGFHSVAILGSEIPAAKILRRYPAPLIDCLDNDGDEMHGGMRAKTKLRDTCTRNSIALVEGFVPDLYKDPASWLESRGADEFTEFNERTVRWQMAA